MTDLPKRAIRRLQERWEQPVITILRRGAPPRPWTGCELMHGAWSLSRDWQRRFGPAPKRLVLAVPPGEDFLVALLAGLLGGDTIVPVAPPRAGTKSSHFQHIVRDSAAVAVLCQAAAVDGLRERLEAAGAAPCPVQPLRTEGEEDGVPAWESLPNRSPDTPAIVQYTSGSTRHPKGVCLGDGQILANCDLVARTWGMNAATRFVNWLPHHHDMGLMGGILYPLLTGGYSVQMNPLEIVRDPANWLRAISEFRATFSGGPAFAFADCLRRVSPEQAEGLDLSSWERAFCGAEPIPAGLLPAFRERFAPHGLAGEAVFGCYGLAEYTLFAAGAPEPENRAAPPPPGCEAVHPCRLVEETRANLRIVDPDHHTVLPDGLTGEIWLRGASCGQGYLGGGEGGPATFDAILPEDDTGGWLRTGDLGAVQGDLLYVGGRLKDTIIANGKKVSAAEIEWFAAGFCEALNPLAAAAFQTEPTGEAVAVLLIEIKPGYTHPERLDDVQKAITRAVLGEWGLQLREVHIVPRGHLERTTSGKVRRRAIAEAYHRGLRPLAVTGAIE